MQRSLERLDQFLDMVITEPRGQPQGPGMNDEGLSLLFAGDHQAQAKKVIYSGFERGAGTAKLLAEELRDVVVEREGGAHILMIAG